MLGRERPAQDVVGRRLNLDAGPVQVGVQHARADEHALPRRDVDHPEEQRGDDARVPGVGGGQPSRPVQRTGVRAGLHLVGVAGGRHLADQGRALVGGQPGHRRERGAQGGPGIGTGQHRRDRRQSRHVEEPDQPQRLGRVAEPAQRLDGGERDEQLGLVVGVLVGPVRCAVRDPEGLLGREPLASLLARRMGLDRQRLRRGEQLDHEGQVGGDVGEAAAVGQPGRAVRVGTEPDLRPGLLRRDVQSEHRRQDRARAPGVVPDGTLQAQHAHAIG